MSDNETLSWSALANTRVGDVVPPKNIPDGHYMAVITGAPKVENKGQKKTLNASFPLRLTEPMDDVDADAFTASDGFKAGGYNLDFWLTPNSLFMYTGFAESMGAPAEASIPESAEYLASCGEPLVVKVRNDPNPNNPQQTFLRIENPMSLAAFNEARANNQQ